MASRAIQWRVLAAGLANESAYKRPSSPGTERHGEAPYVIERVGKRGARYTAVYTDENGRRKSAGTYDTEERAQNVAKQHQSHVRLRLAETSPADKATITVQDFGVKFLREHAVKPNSKMIYSQLLNSHVYPFIGNRLLVLAEASFAIRDNARESGLTAGELPQGDRCVIGDGGPLSRYRNPLSGRRRAG